jgi:pimeloyl-ACP methyl ester carboxylesterase
LASSKPSTLAALGALGALAASAAVVRAKTRAPLEPPGRFVTAAGARLHYVEAGEGTPLVLLHGLGSMVEDFLVSGLVAEASKRYRVLAFDRPGYGHSERPRGRRWDPAEQARAILEALRTLGVHRPIVLGHSWGTSVAIAMALAAPGVPRSLVLASGLYFPSVRLDGALLAPPGLPIVGALLRNTVSPLVGRALWPLWLRVLFHPAPVPPQMSALAWKALRPPVLRAVGEETLQMLPITLAAMQHYSELTLPIVLVAGARDHYVSSRAHTVRLHSMLVSSTLLLSPHAGHMVHHADLPLVMSAIERAAWGVVEGSTGAGNFHRAST